MREILRRLATAVATAALFATATSPAQALPQSSSPIDHLGRPAPHILTQMENFASQPFVPLELRNITLAAVSFFRGGGEGGVPLPTDAPYFNQFVWPTVSVACIDGQFASTGTAIAVPGPAELPLPGADAGQTAFVFTALGTSAATQEQGGMFVHWLNINNGRFGATPLVNNGINPQGPATLSGVADTGHGRVFAWLDGNVTLADATGAPTNTCNFGPTATSFIVN